MFNLGCFAWLILLLDFDWYPRGGAGVRTGGRGNLGSQHYTVILNKHVITITHVFPLYSPLYHSLVARSYEIKYPCVILLGWQFQKNYDIVKCWSQIGWDGMILPSDWLLAWQWKEFYMKLACSKFTVPQDKSYTIVKWYFTPE